MPRPSVSWTSVLGLRAARTPDRMAYLFLADGEEEQDRLTYAALDSRARAIAATLSRFLEPGERALLLYPPGLDFITAFFGCLYAGLIAVPAYPPQSPRRMARLLAMLADAQPAIALAPAAAQQRVRGWLEKTPEASGLPWLATDEIDPAPAGWEPAALAGGAVAFLQYTSGSTATPKGVMVTHDNLLHNLALMREAGEFSDRSVFVSWLPPYHDLGLIGNLLLSAFVGGSCALMAPAAFLHRPARWLEAVSRYGATASGGPNFAWDLCVRKIPPEQRRGLDLSRWEVAFNGAEPVRAETLAGFAAAFAGCGFHPRAFCPCYGLAEATLIVSGTWPGEEPVVRSFAARALGQGRAVAVAGEGAGGELPTSRLVSCGPALAGQELAIVDPATGERCGAGEVGEVWLSGPSVAAGYWRRPEETAAVFRARLRDGRGPFLRTGDLGFLDGGELFIAGRLKDLIILRGRNHYPQDIEATATASHPELRDGLAAAFSVERDGEERLVVVHELGRRSALDVEAAAEAIRSAVAQEHEAHVEEVVLIPAGALPRTSSGKVQRGLCRALLLAGELAVRGRSAPALPAGEAEAAMSAMSALSGAELLALPPGDRRARLEASLRAAVARLVRADPRQLDREQPLSGLGLDSLMAIELRGHVEAAFGVTVSLPDLLQGASLAGLAGQVLDRLAAEAPAAPAQAAPVAAAATAGGGAALPLSYGQRAVWALQRLAPESGHLNVVLTARVLSPVDAAALRQAFQGLMDRHAALRTTYGVSDGELEQRIHPRLEVPFEVVDAAAWSDAELAVRAGAEAHRPFDLENEAPLRVRLFTRGGGEPLLQVAVHHIAVDFWSFALLLGELRHLYPAARAGQPAPLPPQKAQAADFVRWQRELLAGPAGERLRTYWQDKLAGAPSGSGLPADRPRGPLRTFTGTTSPLELDAGLTARLREVARAQGTTLYTLLLAAFQILLHRHSGQEDVLVGSPVSGRGAAALRDVVGLLINFLPLRADLSGDPTLPELLARVRRTVLEALEHQDYPSSLLAERLQVRHDDLFRTLFVLNRSHRPGDGMATRLTLGKGGVRAEVAGLTVESFALPRRIAMFDLQLTLVETADSVAGALMLDADLFDAATVAGLAARFGRLLAGIAADPGCRLSELPLLAPAEVQQLLTEEPPLDRVPQPPAVCLVSGEEESEGLLLDPPAEMPPDHGRPGSAARLCC